MAISLIGCNKGGGDNPGPVINTYTFTFNCPSCRVLNTEGKELTKVDIPIAEGTEILYAKFYLKGASGYHSPLESSVSVKKGEETIPFEYFPKSGEIIIPVVGDLTITASGINKTLEQCTWDEINEISTTGRAEEFFAIYDPSQPGLNCKKVRLKGQNFDHTVRIIDFNHDDLADGSGKAGITFEFANLITKNDKTYAYTRWDSANNYDYRQSLLNDFLNDETENATSVINMLPTDLSKEGIIKPVNKLVGVSTDEGANFTATPFEEDKCPKLFPLAYNELHNLGGTQQQYVIPGEEGDAGIYKYYEGHCGDTDDDKAYRVKKIVDGNNYYYWLRSPYVYHGYDYIEAWEVMDNGILHNTGVSNSLAVAPAFCI